MQTNPVKNHSAVSAESGEELAKSEAFYHSLITHSLDGMLITNEKGLVHFASPSVEHILGFKPEEIVDTVAFEHVHPEDRDLGIKAFQDEVKESPRFKFISVRLRKKSGEWVWCIIRGHNLLNVPHVKGMVIYFFDDTLRKNIEGALLESEQRFVDQEIIRQKQLAQATIDGQEKERLEMGKELHDNINQHLNTTRLYLEVAKEKATGELKEMISFSHKSLAGIIDQIRFLSQSLVPPSLGDIGLVESIQDICDSLVRTHKFKFDFFHRHFREKGLPDKMKLMLFRITQEQINNIIRHAEAHHVNIKLESDAEYIILTIADDGKGFDPANYKKGLGLTNIMNRAGLFNGMVEINAARGKGCQLSVAIPLNSLDLPE
jgi:PAS domain S-box-containing protein